METRFDTEMDASRALLAETTHVLIKHSVKFVVVGGWAPVLFHSSKFGHPGTFDVDILLEPESLEDGTFESASESMLGDSYLRAPKNKFQAHRVLNVGGEQLVYHVDFLNEHNRGEEVDLVWGKGRMKSIYTDSMRAVFKYHSYRFSSDFPGVRFPSPETFIATKAAAVSVKKRPRDAFDIFVTAIDQPEGFSIRWRELVLSDGLFQDANEELNKAISHGDAIDKISRVLNQLQAENGDPKEIPNYEEIRNAFRFVVAA